MAINFFGLKRASKEDADGLDQAAIGNSAAEPKLGPAPTQTIAEFLQAAESPQQPEPVRPPEFAAPEVSQPPARAEPAAPLVQPTPPLAAAAQTLATREDVVAAYKIFLNRMPESEEVITARIGAPRERILSSFLTSKYFLGQPENIALIRRTALQIESRVKP